MEGDQMEGFMAKLKKSDGSFTQGGTIDPVSKATPIRQHTVISLPSIGIKKKKNSLLDAIMESFPSSIDDSSSEPDVLFAYHFFQKCI
jgi:hypothetical protein